MRTLLKKIFVDNWQRKLISLVLAMMIWMIVHHSMTTTKTVHNVSVKLENIPQGKTVEGLQQNGVLSKRISLALTGNKNILEEITSNDIEVIIDASRKGNEWIASISKKNLIGLNPDLNILEGIKKVSHHDFIIKLSNLVTEKIPIHISHPIGEAPKGFQFLDIYPYHFYVTVQGPEGLAKRLKSKGLKLTFNLNDISKEQLQELTKENSDIICFPIPDSWKELQVPYLSDGPIAIDDPDIKNLRIDFLKSDVLPVNAYLPISIFYPSQTTEICNPRLFSILTNEFIKEENGVKRIGIPLYAQGVSRLFVDIVKDMMQVIVLADPISDNKSLLWNVQFICPVELEDRYVSKILALSNEKDSSDIQPHLREEYLRNRFRHYMNRFRLFVNEKQKLHLNIQMKHRSIIVRPSLSNPNIRNKPQE